MSAIPRLPLAPDLQALVLEDSDHTFTVQQWAAFCLLNWPEDYSDLPPPQYETRALPGTEEKIKILARRHECLRMLWHSRDKTDSPELGRLADPGRNGRCERDTDWQAETQAVQEEEMEELPGPMAMIQALLARGIPIGRSDLSPCPECGWRHQARDRRGLRCSWCGVELAETKQEEPV